MLLIDKESAQGYEGGYKYTEEEREDYNGKGIHWGSVSVSALTVFTNLSIASNVQSSIPSNSALLNPIASNFSSRAMTSD